MKKQLKAALAAALALIMALAMIPTSALPRFDAKAEGEPGWTVPAGYNEHDYNKCAAFLEQTDENGVKNGEKLSSSYDPNDTGTWGINNWNEARFEWTAVNGERRIHKMRIYSANLCGGLDLFGCIALGNLYCSYNNLTELNITGCTALTNLECKYNNLTELDVTGCTALGNLYCNNNNLTELNLTDCTALTNLECNNNNLTELNLTDCTALRYLYCYENLLTELDLTGCTALTELDCSTNNLTELDVTQNLALRRLDCYDNNLTELDVTQNPALYRLDCSTNNLTELDVTGCTALTELYCSTNNLTELDLSNNQGLPYDHIRAEGSGFVGCDLHYIEGSIRAYPMNGVVFEGFYNENGELVSEGEWDDSLKAYKYDCQYFGEKPTGTINARFSILGDINGDGEVTPMDALLLMRFCMGVLDAEQFDSRRTDVNGDGVVDLIDVNTVLRITIGLE